MRGSSALLGCAVALTLGGARTVLAQPPAVSPRAVELTVAAAPDEAAPVTRAIEELLDGLGVATRARQVDAIDPREVVEPPPAPEPALARVWMSLHPPHAILYLADGPWERVLVRRVPLPALDEASREQLAQIVHTAVEALLAGARIGLEREEARRELMPDVQPRDAPPDPSPPPPTEPDASVAPAPTSPAPPSRPLAAATSIEGWVGGALPVWADGPLLGGAVFARGAFVAGAGRWRAVVVLEASLRPPRSVEAGGLSIRLRSLDVRIEAGADLSLDPATGLRATAGLTLDVTSIEPRAQSSDVTASEARDDLTPLVSARVGVRRQLWRWLWVTGGVGVEIELVDTRYVLRDGDGAIGVLDPWSVRPWPFVALGGRL